MLDTHFKVVAGKHKNSECNRITPAFNSKLISGFRNSQEEEEEEEEEECSNGLNNVIF